MSFLSPKFIIFLIVVFIINWAVNKRYRYLWLLTASYAFYMSWKPKHCVVLLLVTVISYLSGHLIFIYSDNSRKKKTILYLGIAFLVCILLLFKFWEFWVFGLHELFGISSPTTGGIISIIAPIGISFYILVSIGYMIDIYRGETRPEGNFLKYALFISFFPTILSGPIERSKNLLVQISTPREFDYDNTKRGLLLILYGYFLKLLIANRLAIMVNAAFDTFAQQTGATMMLATIFYGIQLYADFAGYSCIAAGMGKILGYELITNFRQPYLSSNIQEFWKRWHISLSSWLRDYVYISLGGNRKGKYKKYFNLMMTFLISGLWHGTGWQFIVWGALHGVYTVAFNIIKPVKEKLFKGKGNMRSSIWARGLAVVLTFVLVDYAWLFFRASSFQEGILITRQIFTSFNLRETLAGGLFLCGFESQRFVFLLVEILIAFAIDLLHEKNISVSGLLDERSKVFRWLFYLTSVLLILGGLILSFGADSSTFLYTRF